MKIFPKTSFKRLVIGGIVAMVVTSAYAAGYSVCNPPCTQYAQQAYTSAKAYYTNQQTNYCNSLADSSARSACLAGVPAYSEQQAQAAQTSTYNQCMTNCMSAP